MLSRLAFTRNVAMGLTLIQKRYLRLISLSDFSTFFRNVFVLIFEIAWTRRKRRKPLDYHKLSSAPCIVVNCCYQIRPKNLQKCQIIEMKTFVFHRGTLALNYTLRCLVGVVAHRNLPAFPPSNAVHKIKWHFLP